MEKGQRVYAASDNKRMFDYEGTITSIGKKYITITDDYGHKTRFCADTLYSENFSTHRLYESKEKYTFEKNRESLAHLVWQKIDRCRFSVSYEDLIAIKEILDKY